LWGERTQIRIVYDNEAKEGFKRQWGFACLVGENILFDTGGDLGALLFNMMRFEIDLALIDTIVLSHSHGDHVGGIGIVDKLGDVRVFVPRSFSGRFKKKISSRPNVELVEIRETTTISDGVFTTGELGQFTKEQALVVEANKGLVVITGCSHPGLENILRSAAQFGEVYGVIGGFHGFDKLMSLENISLIVPCHCTKRKRDILTLYPKTSKVCAAGYRFEV
jgi:7,8-dihydropterin-6-yl-methyl-4-(beta-D-ribofuranosyl)aminobenzene 5'-phosphate synthase